MATDGYIHFTELLTYIIPLNSFGSLGAGRYAQRQEGGGEQLTEGIQELRGEVVVGAG
tara:strand:- start:5 stop:178 length:174 start_codon:yes stop_codon:yes gene_type:complete